MERTPTSPFLVGLGALAAVAATGAIAVGVSQYAGFALEAELRDKVLERPSRFVPAVRAREAAELAGAYRWLDQPKGVVLLPLERALELTLAERSRP